jgi:hypothetical protein
VNDPSLIDVFINRMTDEGVEKYFYKTIFCHDGK